MNIKEYQDKVRGCWLGKNIGGSLGAPFECKRGVFEIDFYTHDISKGALPNDDLDLQLVWLNAAEKYGKNVNAEILGEYWLSYVVANWSEYGAGKNNMAMGLLPPLSGWYNNHNKDSCGCFIRSEIWACLAPGHPEIAVKYAYEDAIVDHSSEGVYAEIFCAAVESAAFAQSNLETLIDIGLSYIPADCDVALAIRTVQDSYHNGLSWKEARKKVLQAVPGSFGMLAGYEDREPEPDVPVGSLGYDAPSNIGITLIGWIYGEGDFSKSICLAAGCGEDGDCTAATLGSILGIISGASALPQKWLDPIGDEIKTISLDRTTGLPIPDTITQLTERVCRLMPVFMGDYLDILNESGSVLKLNSGNALYDTPEKKGVFDYLSCIDYLSRQPFGVTKKNVLFDVTLDYVDGIHIQEGVPKPFRLYIENNLVRQQWITVVWHIPTEWSVSPCRETIVNLNQMHGGSALNEMAYTITPNELKQGKYDLVLEIRSNGRVSTLFIPVKLIVWRGRLENGR